MPTYFARPPDVIDAALPHSYEPEERLSLVGLRPGVPGTGNDKHSLHLSGGFIMLKRVYAVGTLATVLSALWMLAAPRFAAAQQGERLYDWSGGWGRSTP